MEWYTPEILQSEWSMYAADAAAAPEEQQKARYVQDLILLGQVRNLLMTVQHFGKPLPFIRQALAVIVQKNLLNQKPPTALGLKCSELLDAHTPGEFARTLASYMSVSPRTGEGIIEMLFGGWGEPIREGTLLGLFGARGEALPLDSTGLVPWAQLLAVVENYTPLMEGLPFTRYSSPAEWQLISQDTFTAHSYTVAGGPLAGLSVKELRERASLSTPDSERPRTRLVLVKDSVRMMATNLGHRDNVFVVKSIG